MVAKIPYTLRIQAAPYCMNFTVEMLENEKEESYKTGSRTDKILIPKKVIRINSHTFP